MADEREAVTRLDARLREARERLDRLEERAGPAAALGAEPPARQSPSPAEPSAVISGGVSGHVLFVPSPAGYGLVDRDGAPPAPGQTVTLPEREAAFVVSKLGSSPRPGDRRPCAYLQPA